MKIIPDDFADFKEETEPLLKELLEFFRTRDVGYQKAATLCTMVLTQIYVDTMTEDVSNRLLDHLKACINKYRKEYKKEEAL